jgi:hypothetical protein
MNIKITLLLILLLSVPIIADIIPFNLLEGVTHLKTQEHGLYRRISNDIGNTRGITYIPNTKLVYVGKWPTIGTEGWLYLLDLRRPDSNEVVSSFCGEFDYETDMVINCWGMSQMYTYNAYPSDISYDDTTKHLFILAKIIESPLSVDLNKDKYIDIEDLILFTTAWLDQGIDEEYNYWLRADFNRDRKVNLKDYNIILNNFNKIVGHENEEHYWPRRKWSTHLIEMKVNLWTREPIEICNDWDISYIPHLVGLSVIDGDIWLVAYNEKLLIRINRNKEIVETISLENYFSECTDGPFDVSKSFNNGFFIRNHFNSSIIEIDRQGNFITEYTTVNTEMGIGRGFNIETNFNDYTILLLNSGSIHTIRIPGYYPPYPNTSRPPVQPFY